MRSLRKGFAGSGDPNAVIRKRVVHLRDKDLLHVTGRAIRRANWACGSTVGCVGSVRIAG